MNCNIHLTGMDFAYKKYIIYGNISTRCCEQCQMPYNAGYQPTAGRLAAFLPFYKETTMKTVTFQGNHLTLKGKQLEVGDKMPEFVLTDNGLGTVSSGKLVTRNWSA